MTVWLTRAESSESFVFLNDNEKMSAGNVTDALRTLSLIHI